MEQWVSKICNLSGEKKNECKELGKEVDNVGVDAGIAKQLNDQEDCSSSKEERYQDVGMLGVDGFSNKLIANVTNEETERGQEADDSPGKDTSCQTADASLPSPQILPFETVTLSSRSHSPLPPPLPARIPEDC